MMRNRTPGRSSTHARDILGRTGSRVVRAAVDRNRAASLVSLAPLWSASDGLDFFRPPPNLQFGPALNIGLPDRWFVSLYPSQDIRINLGDPVTGQTGRLFLPLDARAAKKLSDNVAASPEIGVPIIQDYPVYHFKSQFRLNITW
jgi:hypothetical protein